MNTHTPKWASTLEVGVLIDYRIFKEVFQRPKFIGLKISLYHWKALEIYMFKMGLDDPFEYLKHKLWPKERLGIKVSI
jgi:hypothetical protein